MVIYMIIELENLRGKRGRAHENNDDNAIGDTNFRGVDHSGERLLRILILD